MRRVLILGGSLGALLLGLAASIPTGPALSQEKAADSGSVKVVLDGGTDGRIITTTLYREGQVVASKDKRIGGRVEFDKVPLGVIEVRCESPGHKTVIKRALLKAEDRDHELIADMVKGDGTVMVGFGPSVHELEGRVKVLEAAVTKLQGK